MIPPPSSPPPARSASTRADVLLMAAAVADYRPASRARGQAQEGRDRRDARAAPRAHRGRAVRRSPPAAGPASCWSASPPSTARARSPTGATSSTRKGLDAVVVNDVGAPGIGFDVARQRGRDRHRSAGATRAARIEGRDRRGDPGHGLEPPFIIRHQGAPLNGTAWSEAVPERLAQAERSRRPSSVARRIAENIRRAVKVRDDVLEHVIVALLAEGHILVEDYPGVGKTALARALARSIDCQFARVQCTADLLPADIVGTNVYNQREARFEFRPGPIFANVVLVDEINRASPKTQSGPARVHAGAPRDGRRDLARAGPPVPRLRHAEPGRVRGHLPAARGPGRPLHGPPVARLPGRRRRGRHAGRPRGAATACSTSRPSPTAPRSSTSVDAAQRVHASRALRDYVVGLLRHTRADSRVELGASPRAGLMLLRAAKARALVQGRDHALPDDVQALAPTGARAPADARARGGRRRQPRVVADAIAAVPALSARPRHRTGSRGPRATRPMSGPATAHALGARLRGAGPAPAAGRRHVRRRAALRHRLGAGAARRRRAAVDRRRRAGRGVEREISARSVVEEQPLQVRIRASAGRLPLPPGWIDEPLLPEPVRLPAGRRRARVRVEVTFGRRGRRTLAAARARAARPVRARPARGQRRPHGRGAGAAARVPVSLPRAAGTRRPRTPAPR